MQAGYLGTPFHWRDVAVVAAWGIAGLLLSVRAPEMRDRSGLRGGDVGGVAEREHVGGSGRLKRPAIDDDESELIAQPGRAPDELGAAMQGDRDQQVERNLAIVPADQPAGGAVHLTGVELGGDVDPGHLTGRSTMLTTNRP